jgi:uncharacterized protein (DUF1697 family)
MNVYVALLRAVNVGGAGSLKMSDLRAACESAGCQGVRTYLSSGNAVFAHDAAPDEVEVAIRQSLGDLLGKSVEVFVRTSAQMKAVQDDNPFAGLDPKHTYAFFLDLAPSGSTFEGITGRSDEEWRTGAREVYVHYPSGMGRSKLRIPAAMAGTARNMNTVAKLAEMASDMERGSIQ